MSFQEVLHAAYVRDEQGRAEREAAVHYGAVLPRGIKNAAVNGDVLAGVLSYLYAGVLASLS